MESAGDLLCPPLRQWKAMPKTTIGRRLLIMKGNPGFITCRLYAQELRVPVPNSVPQMGFNAYGRRAGDTLLEACQRNGGSIPKSIL